MEFAPSLPSPPFRSVDQRRRGRLGDLEEASLPLSLRRPAGSDRKEGEGGGQVWWDIPPSLSLHQNGARVPPEGERERRIFQDSQSHP